MNRHQIAAELAAAIISNNNHFLPSKNTESTEGIDGMSKMAMQIYKSVLKELTAQRIPG